MSTANPSSNENQQSTRRDQVMVGDLPADFLRLDEPDNTGTVSTTEQQNVSEQQVSSDARVAQLLQAQQTAGFNTTPSNITGRLSITIVQAKLAKNYGLTKMDPYCRVRVGHGIFETPTDSNGAKNPRWNKTVQCYLPVGVDSVYMEVFDECAFSTDARVAWSHISIPAPVFNGDTVDDWFSLSGRQGDDKEGMVNLILSFVPVQNLPPQTFMMPPQPMVIPIMPQMYYPGIAPYPVQAMMAPPQQPATLPQPYTHDDVRQAQDMFPTMDIEVIKSVFEANRGNKEESINALLAMNAA